eukprot:361970-Chlamydomonas_euryale.AAC.4
MKKTPPFPAALRMLAQPERLRVASCQRRARIRPGVCVADAPIWRRAAAAGLLAHVAARWRRRRDSGDVDARVCATAAAAPRAARCDAGGAHDAAGAARELAWRGAGSQGHCGLQPRGPAPPAAAGARTHGRDGRPGRHAAAGKACAGAHVGGHGTVPTMRSWRLPAPYGGSLPRPTAGKEGISRCRLPKPTAGKEGIVRDPWKDCCARGPKLSIAEDSVLHWRAEYRSPLQYMLLPDARTLLYFAANQGRAEAEAVADLHWLGQQGQPGVRQGRGEAEAGDRVQCAGHDGQLQRRDQGVPCWVRAPGPGPGRHKPWPRGRAGNHRCLARCAPRGRPQRVLLVAQQCREQKLPGRLRHGWDIFNP